ncbi:MAG: hypothetical protein O6929_10280 [candidate division NC10 bacterium]|nr:hypothetical protein [candidate division NC10 bacterium]
MDAVKLKVVINRPLKRVEGLWTLWQIGNGTLHSPGALMDLCPEAL